MTRLRMVALQGRIQALGAPDTAPEPTHHVCPNLQSMAEDFRRMVLARCARCQGARGGCLMEAMDRRRQGDDG